MCQSLENRSTGSFDDLRRDRHAIGLHRHIVGMVEMEIGAKRRCFFNTALWAVVGEFAALYGGRAKIWRPVNIRFGHFGP